MGEIGVKLGLFDPNFGKLTPTTQHQPNFGAKITRNWGYPQSGPNFLHIPVLDSHPIIVSAGLSASKVAMATVQMKMLSGRYRTNSLMSHWSKNRSGCCSLSPECIEIKEDIPHILQFCPALSELRLRMYDYVNSFCEASALPDEVKRVLLEFCHTRCPLFCDFLLDCSSIPEVIHLSQRYGKGVLHSCFEVTRTYVYALHRQRLKFLGTWKQSSN